MRKENVNKDTDAAVTHGCGNVFADLGLRNPDDLLRRAQLVVLLNAAIKERKLKCDAVADLLSVKPDRFKRLLIGDTTGFTVDRLLRILDRLGIDSKAPFKVHDSEYSNGRPSEARPTFAIAMRER